MYSAFSQKKRVRESERDRERGECVCSKGCGRWMPESVGAKGMLV